MDATASGSAMELAHSDSESDFSHMEDVTPIVKPNNPKGYLSKEVTESVETKAEQFRNINPKLIRGHLLMECFRSNLQYMRYQHVDVFLFCLHMCCLCDVCICA